jgi:hypothetical protein
MNNVRFQYLYRDGANYKKWAEVVFSNKEALPVEGVNRSLRNAFLPDALFIARQIRVPEVFLTADYPLTPDDHCFHEFYSVEATADPPTDEHERSLERFVDEVTREARRGWKAFAPP